MWTSLPPGVWVSALITILYTFLCLFANILMLWLTWVHRERRSYVALIGYVALLCAICSIVQQMWEYEHWEEFMWAQHNYIQEHPDNTNAWFNNGNYGFRLVLSNIRLFAYTAEAALILSFSISVTGTTYAFWVHHRRAEKMFSLFGKVVPIVLAALFICLLQAPAVQSNWTAYMVIANGVSVLSCVLSFFFIMAIVVQYLRAKRTVEGWREFLSYKGQAFMTRLRKRRNRDQRRNQQQQQTVTSSRLARNVDANESWAELSLNTHSIYDSWLVIRLLILALALWVFVSITFLTHIQEKDHVTKDAQAPAPNLTSSYASGAILGYMPAVTPGLLLFIVFGTTKALRQTMYETFVPRRLRRRHQQHHSEQHIQVQTPSSQRSPYLCHRETTRNLGQSVPSLVPPDARVMYSEMIRSESGGESEHVIAELRTELDSSHGK